MSKPYEYHNKKLGVKINFLHSDKLVEDESIRVVKYDTLHKRMKSDSCTETLLRRASLGNTGLVEFDTICQDWKNELIVKFGEPVKQVEKSFFEQSFILDKKALEFYQAYRFGNDKRPLPFDLQDEYTYNASVLNTLNYIKNTRVAMRNMQGGSKQNLWPTLSQNVNDFKGVAHTLPPSVDGLRRKFSEYLKEGYISLVSGKLSNNNARKVDENILMLLNSLFANKNSKPTATDIARTYDSFLNGYVEVYNPESGELFNPSDFKKLSQATIINYIHDWESKIATFQVRSGNRQIYINKFRPHTEMLKETFAGSMISVDDRQPPFWYEKGKRMWFYIGIDLASECITTFVYGKDKEGIILEFYRQMVRNYTEWNVCLPDGLECESSLNSSYKETILKEGVMFQNVKIEANNARGKKIERYFGKLRYQNEKQREGWIARPFAKMESQQSGPGENKIIPYDQLVDLQLRDIEDWNNTAHTSENEMSRWEFFESKQNPNLRPTNWKRLLFNLGYKTVSSCQVGYVTLQGKKRMIADEGEILFGDALIQKMRVVEGKEVDVYWLDDNKGEVLKAVAFIGDRYICELLPIPKFSRSVIERTPNCAKNIEIQQKYINSIDGFMKRVKQQLQPIEFNDLTPKTLNNKFQVAGLKRFNIEPTEEVEVFEDEEIEITVPINESQKSWDSGFRI